MSEENTTVGEQTTPVTPQTGNTGEIRMSQQEFNSKLANHKRSLQQELAEARGKAEAFEALQGQVSQLLESGIIDGVEDLEDFRNAAATTISKFRTEKETLERNQKAMEKKLTEAQKSAELSRTKYERAMIERAISDSASNVVVDGLGREGAIEYFQLKLGQLAEVQEDGSVVVNWKVKDEETGKVEDKKIPVSEALRDMEANPTKYGRNFRSTVNGGAGGETVDGVRRTPDGGLDFANMDFAKFQELARKNPSLLNDAANKLVF